jgi:hypothetical protein
VAASPDWSLKTWGRRSRRCPRNSRKTKSSRRMRRRAATLISLWRNSLTSDKLILTRRKRRGCRTWSIPKKEGSMWMTYWETSTGMREDTHWFSKIRRENW